MDYTTRFKGKQVGEKIELINPKLAPITFPASPHLGHEVDESRVLLALVEERIAQKVSVIREASFGGFSQPLNGSRLAWIEF